jgi:methylthioribose-1-phosphate isomerase
MIPAVRYTQGQLSVLDQTALPGQVVYLTCTSPEEVADAIKTMKVRGAPLIGIAAGFGLLLAMRGYTPAAGDRADYFHHYYAQLYATRPTAVNLAWALRRMEGVFQANQSRSYEQLLGCLEEEAQAILTEDVEINRQIGLNGSELFSAPGLQVMTICNAGALATGGYGTALGVIRSLHQKGWLRMVWACETRPVLQGSRLTVWELMAEGIPVTLIADHMAAHVLKEKAIDAVIVGADRIAANGDTANKIGSYSLAVLAQYHAVPFYVAAPESTIDLAAVSGEDIPIEERDGQEIREIQGQLITVAEVPVYNPAFDVVPHQLITALITEKGVQPMKA